MCPLFKGLGQAHNYPPLFLTLSGKQRKERLGHKYLDPSPWRASCMVPVEGFLQFPRGGLCHPGFGVLTFS